MKNKTLWKQVGAAAIAAAMVMSTVPATPVQAAGGKTLAVSSQKQLNQALKTVKGKNAVITVKAGENVKNGQVHRKGQPRRKAPAGLPCVFGEIALAIRGGKIYN